nr:hypothetical protein [Tanacetum cinerariifolium]
MFAILALPLICVIAVLPPFLFQGGLGAVTHEPVQYEAVIVANGGGDVLIDLRMVVVSFFIRDWLVMWRVRLRLRVVMGRLKEEGGSGGGTVECGGGGRWFDGVTAAMFECV